MDNQRHGGGRPVAKASTTMELGHQFAELPLVPHNLRSIFQANVTVEIQPWAGERLANGCSAPVFRKFVTDLTNNLTPITDFLAKFPSPGLAFIEALAAGDICFSDEQFKQSTLLFEELKRSNKVKVKAESVKEGPMLEASSSAQERGSADETKDVELVLSFNSEAR